MQNQTDQLKQNFLIVIFFGFVALTLFAPIASNEYLPKSPDFANHIVYIAQAKQALEEGQFPLRTAPGLYNHWQYPIYQFYSPLAYTIAGAIHKWLVPHNPFLAYKITIWLALLLAGIYIYRLTQQFVPSRSAAFLAATLYLFSPYLILTISVRGGFTEALATCLIPLVLYYSIRCHNKPSIIFFLATALTWFALATIHLVTFIFSTFFIGAFLICLTIQNNLSFKNLIYLGCAYGFSWLLAAWFLAPIILLQPYLYTHHILTNPYYTNWLNPLSTLLSPSAVSPMPLPGNGKLICPFYVGIGWPLLLAVGFIIYTKLNDLNGKTPSFLTPLLLLFFFGFFITWSPCNFWVYLPEAFKTLQFGFRILIQLMWMGSLLFAWAIVELFQNKLDSRHVVMGILLISIANSSWFLTNVSDDKKISDLVQHPALYEWGAKAYVISPMLFPQKDYSEKYIPVAETTKLCHFANSLTCQFTLTKNSVVQLPILYYPTMLEIKVDEHAMDYHPIPYNKMMTDALTINPMLTGLFLSPGTHIISTHFVGLRWANVLSIIAWVLLLVAIIREVFIRGCSIIGINSSIGLSHVS